MRIYALPPARLRKIRVGIKCRRRLQFARIAIERECRSHRAPRLSSLNWRSLRLELEGRSKVQGTATVCRNWTSWRSPKSTGARARAARPGGLPELFRDRIAKSTFPGSRINDYVLNRGDSFAGRTLHVRNYSACWPGFHDVPFVRSRSGCRFRCSWCQNCRPGCYPRSCPSCCRKSFGWCCWTSHFGCSR